MKIYDFLILEEQQQYQSVWDLGKHIDDIVLETIHHQLYAIGDFYVEIHYNVSDNKIVGKLAFKAGEPLEKYLRQWPPFESI
jgi:hypothetical protein